VPRRRDGAYHQGTAWAWLLGPFARAQFKVYGAAATARSFLAPLADHLRHGTSCLGPDASPSRIHHRCNIRPKSVADNPCPQCWRLARTTAGSTGTGAGGQQRAGVIPGPAEKRRLDVKKCNLIIASAVAAAFALPLMSDAQGGPAPKPKFESEKCYGIAKAGKNDCQTANSSCAGTSKRDGQGDAWIYMPAGACGRVVGGSLMPKRT
jgi:uncharacterized membrane protein